MCSGGCLVVGYNSDRTGGDESAVPQHSLHADPDLCP